MEKAYEPAILIPNQLPSMISKLKMNYMLKIWNNNFKAWYHSHQSMSEQVLLCDPKKQVCGRAATPSIPA